MRISLFSKWGAAAAAVALVAGAAQAEEVQGLVQPFKSLSLSSPVYVQEVITDIPVKEGDVVKEGQTLVQLRRIREELDVRQARQLVANAEFVYKGADALAKEKMGSMDQALKAKTELEMAKIKLEAAEVALAEKTVKSPISGIVVRKYKEPGESVDRGEKLIDLVNIDTVYVQFYLDPKYMTELEFGQKLNVRFPVLQNGSLEGKVDFIDPRIDASSGLFRVKVLLENPEQKIKAGMRGMADFTKKR